MKRYKRHASSSLNVNFSANIRLKSFTYMNIQIVEVCLKARVNKAPTLQFTSTFKSTPQRRAETPFPASAVKNPETTGVN